MAKKKSAFDRVPQRTTKSRQINMQALAMLQRGDFKAGAELLRQSLVSDPYQHEVHYNYGFALKQLGLTDDAIRALDQCISLVPYDIDALMLRGHLHSDLKQYSEAVKDFTAVTELTPKNADAWNNLGNVLIELQDVDQGVWAYDHALVLNPYFQDALFNKAAALQGQGKFELARDAYRELLEMAPNFAAAKWHLSWIELIHGNFESGWKLFESRWSVSTLGLQTQHAEYPRWVGGDQSLTGKSILIHAEQGQGDSLQFVRYASVLKAKGARVLIEIQPALVRLLENSLDSSVSVLPQGAQFLPVDFQCPLMSLPLACGTRLDSIPSRVPYLRPHPVDVAAWRNLLGASKRLRVGLVWSGNLSHKGDAKRSMKLSDLSSLLSMQHVDFFCLQPEMRPNDAAWLASHPGVFLRHEQLSDFADTAALIENLDLVISVDTSVAHLAGGLGRPVWIMLPTVCDYRWLLEREDSPWYPTARLFRQSEPGNWAAVLSRVAEALKTFSESRIGTSK